MHNNLEKIIERRINNFWGIGNLKGKVWFIGMEEGHGEQDGSVKDRLIVDDSLFTDEDKVKDVRKELEDKNHPAWKWFGERPPVQNTWRPYMYIHLFVKNKNEPSLEEIRMYQRDEFAKKDSDHAVLELMALPARSVGEWPYQDFGIESISTRKKYLDNYKDLRVEKLQELVNEYQPELVIYFSKIYKDDWEKVINSKTEEIIPGFLYLKKQNKTLHAIVPHSVAKGIKNSDWKNISEKILKHLN